MKKMIIATLTLSALLAGTSAIHAASYVTKPTIVESSQASMTKTIDQFLQSKQFNGTLLVAQNGKIVMSKGYGESDFATHSKNNTDTIFRVGSITKQMTAVAIMQLAEKGKLSLDDKVSKFIPEFKEGGKITIRQLLSHTSGISDSIFAARVESAPFEYTSPDELIKMYYDLKLDSEPGTKFGYSNIGYHMLGYIIQKTSHTSWDNYLTENIFKPLKMTRTGIDLNVPVQSNHAIGSEVDGKPALFEDRSYMFGTGAVYSTVVDLLKFDQAVTSGKLISKESFTTMVTPVGANNYGLGWADGAKLKKSSDWKWHNGETAGFLGFHAVNLKTNTEVIMLSNKNIDANEYSGVIASGVIDIVEKTPVKLEKP
ncbi:serine hydrolase domain-containing protein [Paenibacillus aestuarii]|uniref:Serine hydrolase domain-containing protein n=1 Tax=Paenibacillus aestuarii TaxID=516965 RepID=A0ABW0KAB0_9BACL|nr:serine hydrolase [Paenibacillus aestuarii]